MIPSTPRMTHAESYADFLVRAAQQATGHGKPEVVASRIETRTEGRQHPEYVAVFEHADGTVKEFNGKAWTSRALIL